jgi:SAM-dependent methyltransferase
VSSIEFTWAPSEFDDLLAATEFDEAVLLSLDRIPAKSARILEAGAGSGRVLKFLWDRGYRHVAGIELSVAAVEAFNQRFPEIPMIAGDLLDMPFADDAFDVVVSYGVVEHFQQLGPVPALQAIRRVLRPGGTAVVTVPSVNRLRQLGDLRHTAGQFLRVGQPTDAGNPFGYSIYPRSGAFFEYRFRKAQFEAACRLAGFEIVDSRPIYHIDGLYHALGGRWIRFEHWQFRVPPLLSKLVAVTRKRTPFLHNHMQLCVLANPRGRR